MTSIQYHSKVCGQCIYFLEMNTCVQQGHIQLIKIVIKNIFISNKVCKFQLSAHPIKKCFVVSTKIFSSFLIIGNSKKYFDILEYTED